MNGQAQLRGTPYLLVLKAGPLGPLHGDGMQREER
jgi:hypothetical protein